MALPPVTPAMLLVFLIIAAALLLFVTEFVPSDITAIAVLVTLALLEPYTGVTTTEAIAGFASPATVTIVAMYILSAGVQETGAVERLGVTLDRWTRGDETRLLGAVVGSTGLTAGLINNTPVVAVFIPMITGIAERAKLSASRLLLPLSYAAMLGGTLTLIGTSTNILAADLARQFGVGTIGMFTLTPVGLLAFTAGGLYLMTVGRALLPERRARGADPGDAFDVEGHLAVLEVEPGSRLEDRPGDQAREALDGARLDVDLLGVETRDGEVLDPDTDRPLEAGDRVTVRVPAEDLHVLGRRWGLDPRPRETVDLVELVDDDTVAEAVVPPGSGLADNRLEELQLPERFGITVVALRRGDETITEDLSSVELREGDTLLVRADPEPLEYLEEEGDLVVTHEADEELADLEAAPEEVAPLTPQAPAAFAVMGLVVGLAALDLVPIVIAALGGVVAMVVADCLNPAEAYDAVSWNVIFLLAGILPLGVAMQRTGGADLLAALLAQAGAVLPVLALLALVYLVTGLLANVITPVASIVLMGPVAVDTAARVGADGFAFLVAATFASASAFMTPIGYQTNLMVYGPGEYRFTDYLRVGGPLQLLLTVVVPVGIALVYGL